MMWLLFTLLGFVIGFACAAEIGRQVYNRKMTAITKIAGRMERYLSKKEGV